MATETWVLNETLGKTTLDSTVVNFASNNIQFTELNYSYVVIGETKELSYIDRNNRDNDVIAYSTLGFGGWQNEVYRTVTFDEPITDATLLAWLQANGTKQSTSRLSVDLTTLAGWDALSAGAHDITVVAKASGFKDSEKSAAVSVTKAAPNPNIVSATSDSLTSNQSIVASNESSLLQKATSDVKTVWNNYSTLDLATIWTDLGLDPIHGVTTNKGNTLVGTVLTDANKVSATCSLFVLKEGDSLIVDWSDDYNAVISSTDIIDSDIMLCTVDLLTGKIYIAEPDSVDVTNKTFTATGIQNIGLAFLLKPGASTKTLAAGTYQFAPANAVVDTTKENLWHTQDINFSSNDVNYAGMDSNTEFGYLFYENTQVINDSLEWVLPAYQTIVVEIEQGVSDAFYTWFNSVAEKVTTLAAGTYKWVDDPAKPSTNVSATFDFLDVNENSYFGMRYVSGALDYFTNSSGSSFETVYDWHKNIWGNDSYRTITLLADQQVSAEFYEWAIGEGNLVKQADTVTFPDDTFYDATDQAASAESHQWLYIYNNTTGTFTDKLAAMIDADIVSSLLAAAGYSETEANAQLAISAIGDIQTTNGDFTCISNANAVWIITIIQGLSTVYSTTKSGTTFSGHFASCGTMPSIVIVE